MNHGLGRSDLVGIRLACVVERFAAIVGSADHRDPVWGESELAEVRLLREQHYVVPACGSDVQ